jgi:hypothetical protein
LRDVLEEAIDIGADGWILQYRDGSFDTGGELLA